MKTIKTEVRAGMCGTYLLGIDELNGLGLKVGDRVQVTIKKTGKGYK